MLKYLAERVSVNMSDNISFFFFFKYLFLQCGKVQSRNYEFISRPEILSKETHVILEKSHQHWSIESLYDRFYEFASKLNLSRYLFI